MKTIILFCLATVVFGQQPIRRDKAIVPVSPDTRPAAWLVDRAKECKTSDEAVNTAMGEFIDSLKESYESAPSYRKPTLSRERREALANITKRLEAQSELHGKITENIDKGLDNSYGWNKVADGLEVKLMPGWLRSSVTTIPKLVAYEDVDVDMMGLLRPYAMTRWTQPILMRVDRKKIGAYKFSISVYDRFGEKVVTSDEIRCDNTLDKSEVSLMEWTLFQENNKAFATNLEKKLSPLGFGIPFMVSDLTIIPTEK